MAIRVWFELPPIEHCVIQVSSSLTYVVCSYGANTTKTTTKKKTLQNERAKHSRY